MRMIESNELEIALILLELITPMYGFPFTWGRKKKRSAIAVATTTSSESSSPTVVKATKAATPTTSLSVSPNTDHSDPEYSPTRKRTATKKISLKRMRENYKEVVEENRLLHGSEDQVKNVNNYFDLEKDSNLKHKERKQELSVGRSQDDIVDTNQHVDVLPQINDGEGVDGPTEIPDLNIPLDEPVGLYSSIVGLDVNAAFTNKESK